MSRKKEIKNEKQLKTNSYEMERETKGTIHLDKAPEPHTFGKMITEDTE